MKKNAFTLAEVLVTLGIIGVVAALTLPSLIANYQKRQTVVQLKKVYTELSQAIMLSEVKNGDKKDWDYSLKGFEFFNVYLEQFVKVSEITVQDAKTNGITYYQASGQPETGLTMLYNDASIITLSSGAQLFTANDILNPGGTRKSFVVDINGFKKPNKFGKDLFAFHLDSTKGLIPFQYDDGEYNSIKERSEYLNGPSAHNYQCSRTGRGIWCATVIMLDGWEIKDDYPW